MGFIDDHRLLVCIDPTSDAPPSVVLINTEKFVGRAPVRTTFKLSPCFGGFQHQRLIMEQGAHSPSPAELLAPFRKDPAQRLVNLVRSASPNHLVFRVKTLMDFLETREGSEIGWDEWKSRVVIPSIDHYDPEYTDIFVSGCRLFCIDSTDPDMGSGMKVYDFSIGGCAKYLSNCVEDLDVTKRLSSTGAVGRLPWRTEELLDTCSGHDSVVFRRVSPVMPSLILG